VRDFAAGGASSSPLILSASSGLLYFAVNDGVSGNELWRTDGTSAGTVLVRDIVPGAGSSSPTQMLQVGSNLFFAAGTAAQGVEPWVLPATDGVDTDGDGLSDVAEAGLGTNPNNADSDGDGLSDGAETFTYHTNPLLADTDHDGVSDSVEVAAGTDPLESTSTPIVHPPGIPALPGGTRELLAAFLAATAALAARSRARSR
jgi:ELWxxDGT repeat protein